MLISTLQIKFAEFVENYMIYRDLFITILNVLAIVSFGSLFLNRVDNVSYNISSHNYAISIPNMNCECMCEFRLYGITLWRYLKSFLNMC